jgi:hypothetical protein
MLEWISEDAVNKLSIEHVDKGYDHSLRSPLILLLSSSTIALLVR